MTYCPECGIDADPDDKYCRDCGTRLDLSDSRTDGTMSASGKKSHRSNEQETITIGRGSYASHYNAHSIAYIQNVDSSLTLFAWIVVFIPLVMSVIVIFKIQDFISEIIGAGLLTSAILYISLYTSNSTVIGTLNGRNSYNRSIDDIVSEVEDYVGKTISISSKIKGRYNEYVYRYHFIPKNIVKIEEKTKDNGVTVIIIGFSTLITTVVIYFIDDWPLSLFTLIIGMVLAILIYYEQTTVQIHLENGETEKFVMESSDSQQVIEEFSSGVSTKHTQDDLRSHRRQTR